MNRWSKDELRKIGEAEELQIAPLREDRVTYRAPPPSGPSRSGMPATSARTRGPPRLGIR
jgi:hypothetical protein